MSGPQTKLSVLQTWKPPTLTRFEPIELTNASHAVVRRWSAYSPHPPSTQDLEAVWTRVQSVWRSEQSLDSIPANIVRWIPWVVFYPPPQPQVWLGAQPDFVKLYGEWLKSQRAFGPRLVATTIRVILSEYPQELETFDDWLALARAGLAREKNRRLQAWVDRHEQIGLLDKNGPERVGREIMSSSGDFESVRDSLGLDDMAASLGFLRACVRSALDSSRQLVSEAKAAEDLRPITSLVECGPKQLRFPELAPAVADALLLPWVQLTPEVEAKEAIRIFLVGHLGDPRMIHAPKWHGVSEKAVAVMRRWVVGANLEDFFVVIGSTAYDRQWDYREAFWMAYATREYIDNAWVVFGRDAAREARSLFDRKFHHYGRLDGALGNQSVIIMQIDNLIIVEGSHNWTCRVWRSASNEVPRIGRTSYSKFDLTHRADFEKKHMGAESGRWQADLADYIARHTGRRCTRADWMPRNKPKKRPSSTTPVRSQSRSVRPNSNPIGTAPLRPRAGTPPPLTPGPVGTTTSPAAALRKMLAQPGTREGSIAKCVGWHPGLKAAAIADLVSLDKAVVNQVLYANQNVFQRDDDYQWSLRV